MGVFYYEDDTLKIRDEIKFALPLVILIVCGIEWILCLVVTFTSCCCADVDDVSIHSLIKLVVLRSYVNPICFINIFHEGYFLLLFCNCVSVCL